MRKKTTWKKQNENEKNEETEEWPQGQQFNEVNERQAKEEEPGFSLEISDAF